MGDLPEEIPGDPYEAADLERKYRRENDMSDTAIPRFKPDEVRRVSTGVGSVEVERWGDRFVLRIVSPDGDYCSTGMSGDQAGEVAACLRVHEQGGG